jgi:hypothetical protein
MVDARANKAGGRLTKSGTLRRRFGTSLLRLETPWSTIPSMILQKEKV